MAIHKQVDLTLQRSQEIIDQAKEQLDLAKRQQGSDPKEFSAAQLSLEEMSEEIDALIRSATPEQRDTLFRAQQRVRQALNEMVLK